LIERMSPFLTFTRQFGFVAVIATSQDTGPAGSQYLARERKRCFFTPLRVRYMSVHRPPGCRWPAVATSVASRLTVHWPGVRRRPRRPT
jgi:hypothetical protein